MEVTPHLKSVLKTYQHTATKSLHGPGATLKSDAIRIIAAATTTSTSSASPSPLDDYAPTPTFVVQQVPILAQPDTQCSTRAETLLEGETISGFDVGGEKRLCLPQVLNSVLRDFSLPQINQECDHLQIYCSRCTPEQLNALKDHGVLPGIVSSSGLITKTDAERLCSALIYGQTAPIKRKHGCTFAVYHECFGRTKGICYPELYTSKMARCVVCVECQGGFAPHRFVSHVHRNRSENRTVHWGFDVDNWRTYMRIGKDQTDKERYEKCLDEMRERYAGRTPFPSAPAAPPAPPPAALPASTVVDAGIKRKQMLNNELLKDHVLPLKKQKLAEYMNHHHPLPYQMQIQQIYASIDPLYYHYVQDHLQSSNNPSPQQTPSQPPRHTSAFRPVLAAKDGTANAKHIHHHPTLAPPPPPPPAQTQSAAMLPRPLHQHHHPHHQHHHLPAHYHPNEPPRLQNPERVVSLAESERFERCYQPNVALAPPTRRDSPPVKKEPTDEPIAAKYNSEIELSTDTEDSASETSEMTRIEELLRDVGDGVREKVLAIFRVILKENELLLAEGREKSARIVELERRLAGDCGVGVVKDEKVEVVGVEKVETVEAEAGGAEVVKEEVQPQRLNSQPQSGIIVKNGEGATTQDDNEQKAIKNTAPE